MKWVVILAAAAALDLALTLHAILTRHVAHGGTAGVGAGAPRVMSAADLLGCFGALLLIAGIAAIVADGISMARKASRGPESAIRVIDV